MSGVSFLPLLKGQPHAQRKHIFIERGPHGSSPVTVQMSNSGYDLGRAVRSDRYKFIYNCTPWIPYGPVDSGGGASWTQIKGAQAEGKLTKAEFSAGRVAAEANKWFQQRDANNDGVISREEFLPGSPLPRTR